MLISIYEKDGTAETEQKETPMYGIQRIGTFYRSGGYIYEMKDYLGNTRVTYKRNISDELEILSYFDFDPMGMELPGRCQNSSMGDRHSYQGQFAERNTVTGFFEFQLRHYDARITRWIVPDPMGQGFSPYTSMGNNPITNVDPTGGYHLGNGVGGTLYNTYIRYNLPQYMAWEDEVYRYYMEMVARVSENTFISTPSNWVDELEMDFNNFLTRAQEIREKWRVFDEWRAQIEEEERETNRLFNEVFASARSSINSDIEALASKYSYGMGSCGKDKIAKKGDIPWYVNYIVLYLRYMTPDAQSLTWAHGTFAPSLGPGPSGNMGVSTIKINSGIDRGTTAIVPNWELKLSSGGGSGEVAITNYWFVGDNRTECGLKDITGWSIQFDITENVYSYVLGGLSFGFTYASKGTQIYSASKILGVGEGGWGIGVSFSGELFRWRW
jgi:RHS repeat-associated protein